MEHTPSPRAVSVVLNVTKDGRIIIPAKALTDLGVTAPEKLSASVVEGEVVLDTLDAAIREAQAYYRRFTPVDVSMADELIAERRLEALRELRE